MGVLAFYQGTNGNGNLIQTVEDNPGQNFNPVSNNISSMKLYNVRHGCQVGLFESPTGSTGEDFCVVTVKKSANEYVVPSFERNYEDDYVLVRYFRADGTEGKVGRIRVS